MGYLIKDTNLLYIVDAVTIASKDEQRNCSKLVFATH